MQKKWQLTSNEQLQKHALEIKSYWAERMTSEELETTNKPKKKAMPDEWQMLEGIELYPWQEDCIEAWFNNKCGTIKVVTGAGKTILALAIIEQLQKQEQNLHVAIVVPTIVLMNQWKEEILSRSNLPEDAIGFLGGGNSDSFDKGKRVLIGVLKSASDKLPDLVSDEIGRNLLLIVDECHRAGATEMRKVFNTNREYNIGLSATPEREYYDEELDETIFEESYNDSLLGRELGPIVYEMTLKEAFEKGILPKFELRHYALPLEPQERQKYEQLTRAIKDIREELRDQARNSSLNNDSALFSWCQNLAKQDSDLGKMAKQFISKSGERKRLLYNAKARSEAVVRIVQSEVKRDSGLRAVLFHESVEEVMNLYLKLLRKRIPVVAENSYLPDSVRENSIELFRKGIAKVIVSARSLIEGFNVPSADLGVIVASNTSVRQRIQTLGRVLRKGKSGPKDKNAIVYVLYMADTTDEFIYEKTDWNNIVGAERNRYFFWDLKNDPVERDGPPRSPKTKETDIDRNILVEGIEYPGDYSGIQYSCDSAGNVYDDQKRPAVNPQKIPASINAIKGDYGRFKVTPINKYVLVLKHYHHEGWKTLYVTKLVEDFRFEDEHSIVDFDPDTAQLGDRFPNALIGDVKEELLFKQVSGRIVLAKKQNRNELYARFTERASSKEKGRNALKLLEKLNQSKRKGVSINKFYLTREGHAIYLDSGRYYYITTIPEGLEFPGE